MAKVKAPALGAASFNCPHCGAFAHQIWFSCFATRASSPPQPFNSFFANMEMQRIAQIESLSERNSAAAALDKAVSKAAAGLAWLQEAKSTLMTGQKIAAVENLILSRCVSCNELSVWLMDGVIFPKFSVDLFPHDDMPLDIARDFREAAAIVKESPRGSAALLRLSIQKLCVNLGESGEDLNRDIGNLVKKGLNPQVQQALDVVRVIGNKAVHPGQIDLRDDRETAYSLFELVNIIVEIMISQPKRIEEAFKQLPTSALAAIEKRDDPRSGKKTKSEN